MSKHPPIVLCSRSLARQALISSKGYIIYLFHEKCLSYQEKMWQDMSSKIPHPQHTENIRLKWDTVLPHLLSWKRFNTRHWQRYIGLVCDTLVYCQNKPYGKPERLEALKGWLELYYKAPPKVVSICKGGLIKDGKLVSSFECHEISTLQFHDAGKSELLSYIDAHFKHLKNLAGGINIEVFIKKGWAHIIQGELDNVIGLPWKALEKEIQSLSKR